MANKKCVIILKQQVLLKLSALIVQVARKFCQTKKMPSATALLAHIKLHGLQFGLHILMFTTMIAWAGNYIA